MQQQDILVRILRPDEGCYLTEADETIAAVDRTLINEVTLAETDDPSNWREITADEAAEIGRAKAAAYKQQKIKEASSE